MSMTPIALVGRGCVLPSGDTPKALWEAVRAGRDLLTPVGSARWRADHARMTRQVVTSDRAGQVSGFRFDPTGYPLPADQLAPLDPLCHWLLHAGREALREAGSGQGERRGAVVGNLSFPTEGLSRFAEAVWLGRPQAGGDPRNRFMSGLPADLMTLGLDLSEGAFCLDAACASSLYALKIACDWLASGRADLMLAGGVNRADLLFLHAGFSALRALSPTGQSRPFHRGADGLVPAEGCALFALRRLDDAVRRGDRILGVIRGIGLSNDGRSEGALIPSESGQVRALQRAWQLSGLDPSELPLLECHATGTPIGDATELRSTAAALGSGSTVRIGSLKSNLGHLITAAGAAGLLKVLSALEAGEFPPTLHLDQPLPELEGSRFTPILAPTPWQGPPRAAVSAFGFGGNNAHLVVEAYQPGKSWPAAAPVPAVELAVVGLGAVIGGGDFTASLLEPGPHPRSPQEIRLPARGLRFPPRDLEETLPQHLLVMEAALKAVAQVRHLPLDRTSALVGMGCDPEVARYGLLWRLPDLLDRPDPEARVVPPLTSAGVLGTMPNMPANRLNRQLELAGPGFTVSAEELSGLRALEIAAHDLRRGEIDAALVGAVDASVEPVHRAAGGQDPADAAVVLILKRLEDARQAGDRVLAVLPARPGEEPAWTLDGASLARQLGRPHACAGLLQLAAAVAACHHRTLPGGAPWLSASRTAQVRVSSMGGQSMTMQLHPDMTRPPCLPAHLPQPRLLCWSGLDRGGVRQAVQEGRTGSEGPARLVMVVEGEQPEEILQASALAALDGQPVPGAYFREAPIQGELAFVYGGPAGAYEGMGRELLTACPELIDRLAARFARLDEAAGWLYRSRPGVTPTPSEKNWGSSFLTQVHAELTRSWGLRPQATLGFCSGETNALIAMGAWNDLDAFYEDIRDQRVFEAEISGDFAVVQRAWGEPEVAWTSMAVLAREEALREALEGEPRVHLAIINAPGSFVLSGEPAGIQRVLDRLGGQRSRPLHYDLSIHCGVLENYYPAYRALHHRPTAPIDGVRFYSNAFMDSYTPTADLAADALAGQAMGTVDFPRLVEKAWEDGVRIFLEHGPQGSCSRWITSALGDREHLAVPLDLTTRSPWLQAWHARAQLMAAGIEVAPGVLERPAGPPSELTGADLRFPAHWPPVALRADRDRMPPAPARPAPPWGGMARAASPPARQVMPLAPGAIAPRPPRPALTSPSPRPTPASPPPPPIPCADPPRVAPLPVPAASAARQAPMPLEAGGRLAMLAAHRQFLSTLEAVGQAHQRYLSLADRAWRGSPAALATPRPPAPARPPASTQATPAPAPPPQAEPAPARPPTPTQAAPPPARPLAPAEPPARPQVGPDPATRLRIPPCPFPAPRCEAPRFSRADLEWLSSREISARFGAMFEVQDGYRRQVRMPTPPLLLADRICDIQAPPGVLGTGWLDTETDVTWGSWYLHRGRMPAGIMIEAGQADLLLISWMGIDFLNRGERVYRLLGCELTWHDSLPAPGDTLQYRIHVDGHAEQGPVRLFFFHYDCWINGKPRLSVRQGQAGFFTDEELANSMGVLWDPTTTGPEGAAPPALPPIRPARARFGRAEVQAFSEGRILDCFGAGFELAETHTLTPGIQRGRMRLFDEVTELDFEGGPWRRGYLRAVRELSPQDWFLEGHFHQDPCMPGTLMFEGCLQAMAFYLAATGCTLDRDGWRFEPVPGETFHLRCRGQATPASRELVYEIFVDELLLDGAPTLIADLLCTVDGLKAFHCRRMALRLVPDVPLTARADLQALEPVHDRVASVDGVALDERAMLACSWGHPQDAFGPKFAVFDGYRRTGHLPGPPYAFMSRVTHLEAEVGDPRAGSVVVTEYDIPPDAWYFQADPARIMPFGVLMEVALQPCGWLATFLGLTLENPERLFFRNLDGTATALEPIRPDAGTMRIRVEFLGVSRSGGMSIESFRVECSLRGRPVYRMDTVFGHFPAAALATQVGLPVQPDSSPSEVRFEVAGLPGLPTGPLRMLDRVTGYWPERKRMRGEKDVRPSEWFFKAHFFQDPVQPGSLGVQAMLQLMQVYALHTGLVRDPHFEVVASGQEVSWKYRGQVRPHNRLVGVEMEEVSVEREAEAVILTARAWLSVDGLSIYQGTFSIRCRERGEVLDPARDRWLADHCPAYVPEVPALPAMAILDRLAAAAPEGPVEIRDLRLHRWVAFGDGPRELQVAPGPRVALLCDGMKAADGIVESHPAWPPRPPRLAPLEGGVEQGSPYEDGTLFHGPAFQLLRSLTLGPRGSTATLEASSQVPPGRLNPALLDAALHGIPHDRLHLWCPELPSDRAGYPAVILRASFHGPTPLSGPVIAEIRFVGLEGGLPRLHLQLLVEGEVWADLELLEALLPKGPLGSRPPAERVAFLRERRFVPGAWLTVQEGEVTRLPREHLAASDWLPGAMRALYRIPDGDLARGILIKEHVARHLEVHPAEVEADGAVPARGFQRPILVQGETARFLD